MTYLIVPIGGDSIDSIRADMVEAVEAGADLIELRLDMITGVSDDELDTLRSTPVASIPMILTYRSEQEGGDEPATDTERLERLDRLGPIAAYVDVELATWTQSEGNRRLAGSALRRAGVLSQSGGQEVIEQGHRRQLILSRHDFKGRPSSLQADLVSMLGEKECGVPKLAWRARTVRDNFEAFEILRLSPRPMIALCMGDDGLMSRVLAKKFGAFGSFASLRAGLESAPGQTTVAELTQLYRWRRINPETAVYGVIGDAVAHSLSPAVHNAAFESNGLNAVYLPLRVSASYESFKAFMVELVARPWLDFRGLSITAPHKENALRFLKENGHRVDDEARRIGAVNTLRLSPDGAIEGFNTDLPGVVATLEAPSVRPADGWQGKRASVLGAGGVARAVVAGLTGLGVHVTVFNRTPERAGALAEAFGCNAGSWDDRTHSSAELVVNCTRLGMAPDTTETPFPEAKFTAGQRVFDTVYNPLQTSFLNAAAGKGSVVVDGLSLFAHQARMQFLLWTGVDVSYEAVRTSALDAIATCKAEPGGI